jgi:hypothetical protein
MGPSSAGAAGTVGAPVAASLMASSAAEKAAAAAVPLTRAAAVRNGAPRKTPSRAPTIMLTVMTAHVALPQLASPTSAAHTDAAVSFSA